ncbi:hypothetical protein BY996DRAFT_6411089 [Phakopsora pachyrhizi]|nr:hypothetical protein BY996DRAFT_6411089 [Phakopsora pachyrhizi]
MTKPSDNLSDDSFELLLQTLQACLDVQPGQEGFICNLSTLKNTANQHAATVYLIENLSQKIEHLIEAILVCQITANMDSQLNTSHKFLESNTFVWTKPSKNNLPNRPKEWKIKYLPSLFCKEENEAHCIILKNISVQDTYPELQIPRLIEFSKLLFEWAAPKGKSYSNKEVKDRFMDKKIQHRFSLLRACAAYQHLWSHEEPWPKVDKQLEKLKTHTHKLPKCLSHLLPY